MKGKSDSEHAVKSYFMCLNIKQHQVDETSPWSALTLISLLLKYYSGYHILWLNKYMLPV